MQIQVSITTIQERKYKKIDDNADTCAHIALTDFYKQYFNLLLDTLINLTKGNLKVFVVII